MKILLEYDRLGNIRNLSAAQLGNKINSGLDNYSPTDANKLIEEYCKKFFSHTWNNLSALQLLIKENIENNGADGSNNTEFWKFLKKAEATPINFKITPEQGQTLYNCLSSGNNDLNHIDSSVSFLYNPQAYISDAMLKACIFVNDIRNIKEYGLYSNPSTKTPLTVSDVLSAGIRNDNDLKKFINGKQTEWKAESIPDVYALLAADSSAPNIDYTSTDADKKSAIAAYLSGMPDSADAISVWNDIIDNKKTSLERQTIDGRMVETDASGKIDYKKTLINYLQSVKSDDELSFGKQIPFINALIAAYPTTFANTNSTRKLDMAEVKKYADDVLDAINPTMRGKVSAALARDSIMESDYTRLLRDTVTKRKVDQDSDNGELNSVMAKVLGTFIKNNGIAS